MTKKNVQMVFGIENWLRNSGFGTFGQLGFVSIHKIHFFPSSLLIFGPFEKKNCIPLLETWQPILPKTGEGGCTITWTASGGPALVELRLILRFFDPFWYWWIGWPDKFIIAGSPKPIGPNSGNSTLWLRDRGVESNFKGRKISKTIFLAFNSSKKWATNFV